MKNGYFVYLSVIMRVATYIFKSWLIFQTGLRYIWQRLEIVKVCVDQFWPSQPFIILVVIIILFKSVYQF